MIQYFITAVCACRCVHHNSVSGKQHFYLLNKYKRTFTRLNGVTELILLYFITLPCLLRTLGRLAIVLMNSSSSWNGTSFYTHSVLSFCFFSFFFWLLSIAFLLLFSTSFSLHYASILRNLAPFELISKYFASSSSLNDTFKRPFLRPAAALVWSNFFFFWSHLRKSYQILFCQLGWYFIGAVRCTKSYQFERGPIGECWMMGN